MVVVVVVEVHLFRNPFQCLPSTSAISFTMIITTATTISIVNLVRSIVLSCNKC